MAEVSIDNSRSFIFVVNLIYLPNRQGGKRFYRGRSMVDSSSSIISS